MQRLTIHQLIAIQRLANNPLIQESSVTFAGGISRITIISKPDTDWDGFSGVYSLLVKELDDEFPDLEYKGKPVTEHNPIDGMDDEFYFMSFEGEHLVNLIMKKTPRQKEIPLLQTEGEVEISQEQSTTFSWSFEDVLRQEGQTT